MSMFLFIGPLGTPEIILIVLALLLLFGGTQLPKLARALGQSKKEFQKGIKEGESENEDDDRRLNAGSSKSLSGISDEELFEEARRRAQEVRK